MDACGGFHCELGSDEQEAMHYE